MNLCGETDSGPQFFSPSRVQAARDCQRAKETEEAKRLQAIADKKVAVAANKLRKENEKKEREASTASRRAEAERKKADKEAKKLHLQEARLAAEQLHQESTMPRKSQKGSKKVLAQRKKTMQRRHDLSTAPQDKEVISGASRTRTIRRPSRYNM